MDDEEPLPGTSKQIEERSDASRKNSNSEIGKDGIATASETSVSNSISENSQIEMSHERMGNKLPTDGKERKPKERKKKLKRAPMGRVVKRKQRRLDVKKLVRRRSKRPTNKDKKRHFSVSTVFTKLSGPEPIETCPYCGHRCCNRRYYYSYYRKVRKYRGRRIRNYNQRMRRLKDMGTRNKVKRKMLKRCIQVGSRCLMLSPLCVNTGAPPPEPPDEDPLRSCEISPEMIIQSLKRLSMFRAAVETNSLLNHLKCNYPVGSSPKLYEELAWKLHIATRVGIVREPFPGKWVLTCALMRRKLDKNHVTLFWDLYRNSLKPVIKKTV